MKLEERLQKKQQASPIGSLPVELVGRPDFTCVGPLVRWWAESN